MNKKNISIISVIGIIVVLVVGYGYFSTTGENNKMMDDSKMIDDKNMSQDTEMMDEDKGMTDVDMSEDSMKNTDENISSMSDNPMETNKGDMAYNFDLMTIDGKSLSLESLKGEKVYLKFWASWCPICLAGLEDVDMLSGEMGDFKVITIVSPSYNGEMDKDKFIEWFEGLGIENMTVLLDEKGSVAKQYGVRGYPTSVFIGSDGVLIKSIPGHIDNQSIKDFIDTFN